MAVPLHYIVSCRITLGKKTQYYLDRIRGSILVHSTCMTHSSRLTSTIHLRTSLTHALISVRKKQEQLVRKKNLFGVCLFNSSNNSFEMSCPSPTQLPLVSYLRNKRVIKRSYGVPLKDAGIQPNNDATIGLVIRHTYA